MAKAKLIVFGEDWGAHPSSTQHLMRYISEQVDVVWINSIGLRQPKLNWHDAKRLCTKFLAKFRASKAPSRQVSAHTTSPFVCISPWVIPMPKHKMLQRLNRWLLRWQLRTHLKDQQPVWVWTSLPSAVDYLGNFAELGWVYYCGDDFSALAGVDHAPVAEREQTLAQHCQKIWCASERLQTRFNTPACHYLPHGVDWNLFSQPAKPAPALRVEQPTLGFYGAIAPWLNQALLVEIARALPHWRIMLVGPSLVDTALLQAEPNISILPAVAHEQLPSYVQHWQAAILPFHDNEQIRACNPLKLREYLASGTPILSTAFPAMQAYAEHLTTIENSGDAIAQLQKLECQPELPAQRLARQQAVEQESWQQRASEVLDGLRELGVVDLTAK